MTASDCEIKVLALVLTFVCASTQFAIIDNILRTKCLFLDHNLMSKDNHWKLYERFTVTDVLKSDWKSRLRHCFCTIKRRQIKKNQINAHIMNMNTALSPSLGKSHSNEMKNWTRLQNHDESVLRFQQQSIYAKNELNPVRFDVQWCFWHFETGAKIKRLRC